MKLHFTVSRLMFVVLLIAVSLGAIVAGAFTFAVVTLCETTLFAFLTRGSSRAFLAGCSAFGWAFMLLAFWPGSGIRSGLPTIRPIIRVYEAIYGPWPTVFKSQEEAERSINLLVKTVNEVITIGHSLIVLALALVGGVVFHGIFKCREFLAKRRVS